SENHRNDGGSDAATGDAGPPITPGADPSFGAGGLATVNFGPGIAALWAVTMAADGRIIAVGATPEAIVVARVLPNGALDPAFGAGGIALTPMGEASNGISPGMGVALQPDGKIVVAGRGFPLEGGNLRGIVLRYAPDGTLDSTFNGRGYVTVSDVAYPVVANAVAVQ